MKVLVINVGSTSVKYDLYEMDGEASLADGTIERLGEPRGRHRFTVAGRRGEAEVTTPTVKDALAVVLQHLASPASPAPPLADPAEVRAVGHRVVHGGARLVRPAVLSDDVKREIHACAAFAPLHNPKNLEGIAAAEAVLPHAVHVAVFDTAFHATLPPRAFTYAVPYALYTDDAVRRYGFHGPSHQYMAEAAAAFLGNPAARLITCHLGGGASVAAIDGGRSIDTSMGMTPLEGLVMGTRSGDVDPALALVLARRGTSIDDIDVLLNRRSGLLGISGVSSDLRDIERAAESGNQRARLAIDVFVYRLKKYIGAYAAALGGADAVVFTGGIGENSAAVRAAATGGLDFMGITLDGDRNQSAAVRAGDPPIDVAAPASRTRVLVLATDEERVIAREVARAVAAASR